MYEPTWRSLDKHRTPKWFVDAKLGLFALIIRSNQVHEYTRTQTLIANLPYAIMLVTGAAVLAWPFDFPSLAWAGAAVYLAYGVGGAVWIMLFVCRSCAHFATRGCPWMATGSALRPH